MSLEMFFSCFVIFSSFLFAYMYFILWLIPERTRNKLRQQGITGPSPCLLYGNSMEIKRFVTRERAQGLDRQGIMMKHDYAQRVFPYFEHWRKIYGPIFQYSMGNVIALHISHPDVVKEISLCTSLNLGKPRYLKKTQEPLFGQGILKSSGKSWLHQRKIIAPEFFSDKVKGMVDLMVDSASQILNSWEERFEGQGVVEMHVDEDLRRYSADVISRACFGSNYAKGEEIFLKLRALQKAVSRPSIFAGYVVLRCFPTKQNQEVWRLNREINSLILKIVKEGDQEVWTSQKNLLDAILCSANSSFVCSNTSNDFIVDNCKNIFFAGHETTAVTATWCLMLLALHQQWQTRARDEVLEVWSDGILNVNSLQKMKILTMIIQETLRLYPPGALVAREALTDMQLSGIHIPKGINIFVPVTTLHHDPNVWGADVDKFNPERFANGVVGACQLPQTYLPFGAGPRTCLAQNFAMVELKIILSLILKKFSFSLSPKYCHSPTFRLIVEPEFGVVLLMKKVKQLKITK